jgi:hypothetical protein
MDIKRSGAKSIKEEAFMQFGTRLDLTNYKAGIKRK